MDNTKEFDELKLEADELGIGYHVNISYKTLLKRVNKFKNAAPVEESPPEEDIKIEEVTGKRYCKGLFVWRSASDFSQNKNYSDTYLKSKGFFKEDK